MQETCKGPGSVQHMAQEEFLAPCAQVWQPHEGPSYEEQPGPGGLLAHSAHLNDIGAFTGTAIWTSRDMALSPFGPAMGALWKHTGT